MTNRLADSLEGHAKCIRKPAHFARALLAHQHGVTDILKPNAHTVNPSQLQNSIHDDRYVINVITEAQHALSTGYHNHKHSRSPFLLRGRELFGISRICDELGPLALKGHQGGNHPNEQVAVHLGQVLPDSLHRCAYDVGRGTLCKCTCIAVGR